jgi:polysaccharide biosynthesis/export protein
MRTHTTPMRILFSLIGLFALGLSVMSTAEARQAAPAGPTPSSGAPGQTQNPGLAISPAPDYVIGPEDVLSITFYKDPTTSGDFVVRPDGKISLLLINEIMAAGLTPEQLRANLTEARKKFEQDPTVFVVVKAINSKKVYISGQVAKAGAYPMVEPTTVLQLIQKAGGLSEFADKKSIIVIRKDPVTGKNQIFKVNYDDFWNAAKLAQNIELKPGDSVLVK